MSPPGNFISLEDAIAKARSLVDAIEATGIAVQNGSRLRLYVQELENALKGGGISKNNRRSLFAYQEIPLLGFIFDWLKVPPEAKGWREKFRVALKGNYFPGEGNELVPWLQIIDQKTCG